jgi:hypothetical protein
MSAIHKIEAAFVINGQEGVFETLFTKEDDAKNAIDFLKGVEEVIALQHTMIEPVTFDEFKDRLGKRIDEIRKDYPVKKLFEAMVAANKVAA